MEFFDRLERARSRCNVLDHPFYQRWSAGELRRDELATYAGEYRHAVVALAQATTNAARAAEPATRARLEAHAAEEVAHVELWDDFASALSGVQAGEPTPETAACVAAWAGDGQPLEPTLVTLYAIESGQPAISETKLAGLRAHYGIEDRAALAYFELHATRDHEHAAEGRALIEPRLPDADEDSLVAAGQRALRANWELLDGVERLNGRGAPTVGR